jgi:dinuclear metal center YbgI/SA1388 family protein
MGMTGENMLVENVCQILEQFAPLATAETWDNVGLLLGHPARTVRRLMTCLTLTPAVASEAITKNVQLIVTHHPVLFRATKSITSHTIEGRLLLDLIEARIAVYSPHTAFDNAEWGINQWLAESLGLQMIEPLRRFPSEIPGGSGRKGLFAESHSKQEFLEKLTTIVGAKYLEVAWHGADRVRRVGFACGSAAEYLSDALEAECDTFVTGEARFQTAVECQSRACNLVLTGHFSSERPAVVRLARVLSEQLREVECFASEEDRNPLELFQMPHPASCSTV